MSNFKFEENQMHLVDSILISPSLVKTIVNVKKRVTQVVLVFIKQKIDEFLLLKIHKIHECPNLP